MKARLAFVLALVLGAPGCGAEPGERSEAAENPRFPSHRTELPVGRHALAYVTNSVSDSVSVVDLDSMTVLANVPIGLDPVDPDGPTDLALDEAGGILYVVLSYPVPPSQGPHAAHHATARHGFVEALALDDLHRLGSLEVDSRPAGIALATDRSTLLVAHEDIDRAAQLGDNLEARRAAVWVVEPGTLLGTGPASARAVTVCAAPFAVAYAASDARAFVTCTGEDSVAVLDPADFAVPARIPITVPRGGVTKPYAAAPDPARQRLVVSSTVSRAVTLIGMNDMAVVWTVAFDGTPGRPAGVPYFAAWTSDSELIVPVQSPDGIARLDAESGSVLAAPAYSADDCSRPRQAVAGAGGRVFLVCEGDHFAPGKLVELDATTLAVTRSVALELGPDRMAILPARGSGS